MSKIMEIISSRLDDKELLSCEINRLIKDVFNIISQDINHESSRLKQILKTLGWEERILYYPTVKLICLYLEGRREIETYCSNSP
jgi:hypothetical protein